VLLELLIKLIESVLGARANSGEGRNGRQRRDADGRLQGTDGSLEKTNASGHLGQTAKTGSEGALERRDIGVELILSALHEYLKRTSLNWKLPISASS
jgi:hypothetical protein